MVRPLETAFLFSVPGPLAWSIANRFVAWVPIVCVCACKIGRPLQIVFFTSGFSLNQGEKGALQTNGHVA